MSKYLLNLRFSIILSVCLLCASSASAQFAQVLQKNATWRTFVTSKGTVLASTLTDGFTGGIMRSTDQGMTWSEAEVLDFNYGCFLEHQGEIYAFGSGCVIAKSADDGLTWDYAEYTDCAKSHIANTSEAVCYDATALGSRIYLADLYCGVMYSDDKGITWTMTDTESLKVDGYKDSIYGLTTFKDTVYAMGLYCVFAYDADANKWAIKRGSNCMGIHTQFQGRLVCGHASPNVGKNQPYLEWTENGSDWQWMTRPVQTDDNYIRALTSDDHAIYAGMLESGLFVTNDFGQSWADASAGLPASRYGGYLNLIGIAQDEDYVYAAIFVDVVDVSLYPESMQQTIIDEFAKSGIWRLAKADIPEAVAGIKDVSADSDCSISVSCDRLVIKGEVAEATIYDLAGKRVMTFQGNEADTSAMPQGIYVCLLTKRNGSKVAHKFVK